MNSSKDWYERSLKLFPGGVNSPVRSFKSVGCEPKLFAQGLGPYMYDTNGQRYIDFCCSWGPLILGHLHPYVVQKLNQQISTAMTFGATCPQEILLGEEILNHWFTSMEKLRFVNSGTEASMSVLRLARGYTSRKKIVKFEGCYHGHVDSLLISAGSGLAQFGEPTSPGVINFEETLVVPYNDLEALQAVFKEYGEEIAAVMIEPMAANMGLVLPQKGFLEGIRSLTTQYKSLFIFDEVMTGFRIHKGGSHLAFGVQPDLWTMGKIVGGGLPAAAYGGKKEIMDWISPSGPIYQAGTLSGNPLAMAAGLATLQYVRENNVLEHLEELGKELDLLVSERLEKYKQKGLLLYVRKASFFCFFFGTTSLPQNFKEVDACNMDLFSEVYAKWLETGVYMGPSGYEVGFLSYSHNRSHLEKLLEAIAITCEAIR